MLAEAVACSPAVWWLLSAGGCGAGRDMEARRLEGAHGCALPVLLLLLLLTLLMLVLPGSWNSCLAWLEAWERDWEKDWSRPCQGALGG